MDRPQCSPFFDNFAFLVELFSPFWKLIEIFDDLKAPTGEVEGNLKKFKRLLGITEVKKTVE